MTKTNPIVITTHALYNIYIYIYILTMFWPLSVRDRMRSSCIQHKIVICIVCIIR